MRFTGQNCVAENAAFFPMAQPVFWEYAAILATILQKNTDKFASFPAST
jgi:hypothetical protein